MFIMRYRADVPAVLVSEVNEQLQHIGCDDRFDYILTALTEM